MMRARTSSPGGMRVALVAGGTGGHIIPAIALGQALGNIGCPVQVTYVCGKRDVELDIYARHNIEPEVLPVGSMLARGLWQKIWKYGALGCAFLKSLWLVGKMDAVVGMGGYVSAPFLLAASIRRRPIILHEQNTILGRVNRWMAKRAYRIACGMPLKNRPAQVDAERFAAVGNPVRLELARGLKSEAAPFFYMQEEGFTILVCGGSLGAPGLNSLVAEALGLLSEQWSSPHPLQVIWSTGKSDFDSTRERLRREEIRGRVWMAPHIERMRDAFAMADIVIGRAGASFLAECLLCGKPSILVPYPAAMENHQLHNASVLQRHDAAIILEESDASAADLAEAVMDLAGNGEKRKAMSRAAKELACPDAARDMALLVMDTILKESK